MNDENSATNSNARQASYTCAMGASLRSAAGTLPGQDVALTIITFRDPCAVRAAKKAVSLISLPDVYRQYTNREAHEPGGPKESFR